MKRALLLLLACAACGKSGELARRAGQPVPPVPFARAEPPAPAEQLARQTQAAPRRVDDPLVRSEARPADPFDPPPRR